MALQSKRSRTLGLSAALILAGAGLVAASDSVPPILQFAYPGDAATVNTNTPSFLAFHVDADSGVVETSVAFYIDGLDVSGAAAITSTVTAYQVPLSSPLTDGSHTARLVAQDAEGNVADQTFLFTIDTAAPTLATNPASGAVVSTLTPVIQVDFADNGSGIVDDSLEILVNNVDRTADFTINSGQASLTINPGELFDGALTIAARVLDQAGNEAQLTSEASVDTSAPSILILPEDGGQSSSLTPKITVAFNDGAFGSGVDINSLEILVDSVDQTAQFTIEDGVANWTPGTPLSSGSHTVQVNLDDQLGHSASASSTFAVDSQTPQVTLISPAAGAQTKDSRAAITALVTDDGLLDRESLQVFINGLDLTERARFENGYVHIEQGEHLPMSDGYNDVRVVIADLVGNTADTHLQFLVDSTPPILELSPDDDSALTTEPAALSAAMSDATAGLDLASLSFIVNGVDQTAQVTVNGDTATLDLSGSSILVEGNNLFQVTISDAVGNAATSTHTLTIDSAAPAITATPQDGALVNDLQPVVSIELSDAAAGSGIDHTSLVFLVDGVDRASEISLASSGNTASGSWRAIDPLSEGSHSFEITIADRAGNTTTESFSLTTEVATTSFQVEISPAQASAVPVLTANTLTISARTAGGAIATDYRGLVEVTTSEQQAPLHGLILAFEAVHRGVISLPNIAEFKTVGAITVTATALQSPYYQGSLNLTTTNDLPVVYFPTQAVLVDQTFGLSGLAFPGQSVEILVGGQLDGSVTANADGSFTYAMSLGQGSHTVEARATHPQTSQVETSDPVVILAESRPAISNNPAFVSNNDTRTIEALGYPGEDITLYIDGVAVQTQTADAQGLATFVVTLPADGNYSIEFITDLPGGGTAQSGTYSFDLDRLAPPAPTLLTPIQDRPTHEPALLFSGAMIESGRLVYRLNGGSAVDLGFFEGPFEILSAVNLDPGSNLLELWAVDAAGNASNVLQRQIYLGTQWIAGSLFEGNPSGASAYEGASVLLHNANGDVLDEAESSENGFYFFAARGAGEYISVDPGTERLPRRLIKLPSAGAINTTLSPLYLGRDASAGQELELDGSGMTLSYKLAETATQLASVELPSGIIVSAPVLSALRLDRIAGADLTAPLPADADPRYILDAQPHATFSAPGATLRLPNLYGLPPGALQVVYGLHDGRSSIAAEEAGWTLHDGVVSSDGAEVIVGNIDAFSTFAFQSPTALNRFSVIGEVALPQGSDGPIEISTSSGQRLSLTPSKSLEPFGIEVQLDPSDRVQVFAQAKIGGTTVFAESELHPFSSTHSLIDVGTLVLSFEPANVTPLSGGNELAPSTGGTQTLGEMTASIGEPTAAFVSSVLAVGFTPTAFSSFVEEESPIIAPLDGAAVAEGFELVGIRGKDEDVTVVIDATAYADSVNDAALFTFRAHPDASLEYFSFVAPTAAFDAGGALVEGPHSLSYTRSNGAQSETHFVTVVNHDVTATPSAFNITDSSLAPEGSPVNPRFPLFAFEFSRELGNVLPIPTSPEAAFAFRLYKQDSPATLVPLYLDREVGSQRIHVLTKENLEESAAYVFEIGDRLVDTSDEALPSPVSYSFTTTSFLTEPGTPEAPLGSVISPPDGAMDVDPEADMVFRIQDVGSGLDLDSVQVLVLADVAVAPGQPSQSVSQDVYRTTPNSFFYSGTGTDATVRIHFPGAFPSGSVVTVFVTSAADHDGNLEQSLFQTGFFWSFTVGGDQTAPLITPVEPQDGATNVAATAPIVVDIVDADSGVDLRNTTIEVNGELYSQVTQFATDTSALPPASTAETEGLETPFPNTSLPLDFRMPFGFPFDRKVYSRLRVYAHGYLDLVEDPGAAPAPVVVTGDATKLSKTTHPRIAPFWTELKNLSVFSKFREDDGGLRSFEIRWEGETADQGSTVSTAVTFAVRLYEDGRYVFRFDGNDKVFGDNSEPAIGASGGVDGGLVTLVTPSAWSQLTNTEFAPENRGYFTVDSSVSQSARLQVQPLEPLSGTVSVSVIANDRVSPTPNSSTLTYTFSIDSSLSTAPNPPSITSLTSGDRFTGPTRLPILGIADPLTTVTVYDQFNNTWSAIADSEGVFFLTTDTVFPGPRDIFAFATNNSGLRSGVTGPISVSVDQPPREPTPGPDGAFKPVAAESANGLPSDSDSALGLPARTLTSSISVLKPVMILDQRWPITDPSDHSPNLANPNYTINNHSRYVYEDISGPSSFNRDERRFDAWGFQTGDRARIFTKDVVETVSHEFKILSPAGMHFENGLQACTYPSNFGTATDELTSPNDFGRFADLLTISRLKGTGPSLVFPANVDLVEVEVTERVIEGYPDETWTVYLRRSQTPPLPPAVISSEPVNSTQTVKAHPGVLRKIYTDYVYNTTLGGSGQSSDLSAVSVVPAEFGRAADVTVSGNAKVFPIPGALHSGVISQTTGSATITVRYPYFAEFTNNGNAPGFNRSIELYDTSPGTVYGSDRYLRVPVNPKFQFLDQVASGDNRFRTHATSFTANGQLTTAAGDYIITLGPYYYGSPAEYAITSQSFVARPTATAADLHPFPPGPFSTANTGSGFAFLRFDSPSYREVGLGTLQIIGRRKTDQPLGPHFFIEGEAIVASPPAIAGKSTFPINNPRPHISVADIVTSTGAGGVSVSLSLRAHDQLASYIEDKQNLGVNNVVVRVAGPDQNGAQSRTDHVITLAEVQIADQDLYEWERVIAIPHRHESTGQAQITAYPGRTRIEILYDGSLAADPSRVEYAVDVSEVSSGVYTTHWTTVYEDPPPKGVLTRFVQGIRYDNPYEASPSDTDTFQLEVTDPKSSTTVMKQLPLRRFHSSANFISDPVVVVRPELVSHLSIQDDWPVIVADELTQIKGAFHNNEFDYSNKNGLLELKGWDGQNSQPTTEFEDFEEVVVELTTTVDVPSIEVEVSTPGADPITITLQKVPGTNVYRSDPIEVKGDPAIADALDLRFGVDVRNLEDGIDANDAFADPFELIRTQIVGPSGFEKSPYEAMPGTTPFSGYNNTVCAANGEFVFSLPALSVPCLGPSWSFVLTYRSQILYSGSPVGNGWDHNLNQRIGPASDGSGDLQYFSGDGRIHRFRLRSEPDGPEYEPPPGLYALLNPLAGGGYELLDRHGLRMTFAKVDTRGDFVRLLRIEDRHGNRLSLTYADGRLIAATDSAGETYRYDYDTTNRLICVTDYTQRQVRLFYHDGNGDDGQNDDLKAVSLPVNDPKRASATANDTPQQRLLAAWYFVYNKSSNEKILAHNLLRIYDPLGTVCNPNNPNEAVIVEVQPKPYEALIVNGYGSSGATIDRITTQDYGRPDMPAKDPGGRYIFTYTNEVTTILDPVNTTWKHNFPSTTEIGVLPENSEVVTARHGLVKTEFEYNDDGEFTEVKNPLGDGVRTKYFRSELPSDQQEWALSRGNLVELQKFGTSGDLPAKKLKYYDSKDLVPYGDFNLLRETIDELGHTITYTRDDKGDLREVRQQVSHYALPDTNFSSSIEVLQEFNYLDNGLVEEAIDAAKTKTKYKYTDRGYLDRVTHGISDLSAPSPSPDLVINPGSVEEDFDHDRVGNLVKHTDRRGVSTIYIVDHWNLVREVVRASEVTGSTADLKPLQYYTHNYYDVLGRLTKTSREHRLPVEAGSRASNTVYDTLFKYDAVGRTTVVSREKDDGVFATEARTYDALGRVIKIKTPLASGLTSPVFEAENVDRFEYTERGSITKTFRGETGMRFVEETLYDQNGNPEFKTKPSGVVVRAVYDDFDRLSTLSRGNAGQAIVTTTYLYDPKSRVTETKVTGSGGIQVQQETILSRKQTQFDERDFVVKNTVFNYWKDSGGTTKTEILETYFERDARGLSVRVLDANGQVAETTFDTWGRPVYEVAPVSQPILKTSTVYDCGDNVTRKIQDELDPVQQNRWLPSKVLSFRYDALGRVSEKTAPNGGTSYVRYDSLDRVVLEADSRSEESSAANTKPGFLTTHSYDGLGNTVLTTVSKTPVQITGNGSWQASEDLLERHKSFDLNSRLAAENNSGSGGASQQYFYDVDNRLIRRSTAALEKDGKFLEKITYDSHARPELITNAVGANRTLEYDDLSRLKSIRLGAAGELGLIPGGNTSFPTRGFELASYVYDGLGRTTYTSVESDDGFVENFVEYDTLGRVTLDRQAVDGDALEVRSRFSALSRTGIIYPDGWDVELVRDTNGRISELKEASTNSKLASFLWTGANRLRSIKQFESQGGQVETKLIYNDFGQLKNKITSTAKTNGALAYSYKYDRANNITQELRIHELKQADTNPDFHYSYDGANRLSEASEGQGSTEVKDLKIHRDSSSQSNEAQVKPRFDGFQFYVSDILGRTAEVWRSDTFLRASFAYDGFGRRVVKRVYDQDGNVKATRYVYDQQQVLSNLTREESTRGSSSNPWIQAARFLNGPEGTLEGQYFDSVSPFLSDQQSIFPKQLLNNDIARVAFHKNAQLVPSVFTMIDGGVYEKEELSASGDTRKYRAGDSGAPLQSVQHVPFDFVKPGTFADVELSAHPPGVSSSEQFLNQFGHFGDFFSISTTIKLMLVDYIGGSTLPEIVTDRAVRPFVSENGSNYTGVFAQGVEDSTAGVLDGLTTALTIGIYDSQWAADALGVDAESGFYSAGKVIGTVVGSVVLASTGNLGAVAGFADELLEFARGIASGNPYQIAFSTLGVSGSALRKGLSGLFSKASKPLGKMLRRFGATKNGTRTLAGAGADINRRAARLRSLGNPHVPQCFLAGTKVLTENGRKNIEDIKVGDKVLSKNDETGKQGYKRVSRLFHGKTDRVVNLRIRNLSKSRQRGRSEAHSVGSERSGSKSEEAGDSDGSDPDGSGGSDDEQEIRCTPEHPFFVRGRGWVEAEKLEAGDRLVGSQGEDLEVAEASISEEEAKHYNFEVEDWHTYFVSETEQYAAVWVHNTCWHGYTAFRNKFPEHEIGTPALFSVSSLAKGDKIAKGNYVVLEDGTLILGRKFDVFMRGTLGGGHIDLAQGKRVLAAGEFKIYKGLVKKLDNASGHYLPRGPSAKAAAIRAFDEAGFTGAAKKYKERFSAIPLLPDELGFFRGSR